MATLDTCNNGRTANDGSLQDRQHVALMPRPAVSYLACIILEERSGNVSTYHESKPYLRLCSLKDCLV